MQNSTERCEFLNYPIAHHEYTRKLLAEEAELQPEFAADLIGQTPHPALAKKLDRGMCLGHKDHRRFQFREAELR